PVPLRAGRAAAPDGGKDAAAAAKAAATPSDAAPEAAGASAGPLPLPGVYKVLVAQEGAMGGAREEPSLAFAAHLDPRESDLRRVDEAELKAQLGGAGSAQVAASAQAAEGSRGTPLWTGLLLLGVLALLGEGALTRK